MNIRWIKWVGLGASVTLVAACFMTWVTIVSKNLNITGVDAAAIDFGKPGYLHIIFAVLFLIFTFIPKTWAKRWNLPFTALNIAWAVRNYILISACSGGECPVKHVALYLLIPAAVLMLISALLPDITLNKK